MAAAALPDGRHRRLVFQPLERSEDVGKGNGSMFLQLGGLPWKDMDCVLCFRSYSSVVGAKR